VKFREISFPTPHHKRKLSDSEHRSGMSRVEIPESTPEITIYKLVKQKNLKFKLEE